ncbi:MAG: hypothetical protein WCK13_07730 [Ignavibacteriota bacterium]
MKKNRCTSSYNLVSDYKAKKLEKEDKKVGRVYIPDGYSFDDKQKYFLYAIYNNRLFKYKNNDSDFIPINAEILKSIIGRYNDTIISLKKLNIIERDNHYIPGVTSRGYRFSKYFKFKVDYIKDVHILTKIKKWKKNYEPKEAHLKFLKRNLYNVSVNMNTAMQIINEIDYNSILKSKQNRKRTKSGKKKIYSSKEELMQDYYISIKLLSDKDFRFVEDKTSGRIHSNISSLKRELRKSIHFKGKPLYELDCANSQNFLFNAFIKRFFEENSAAKIFGFLNPDSFVFSTPDSYFNDTINEIKYIQHNINHILPYPERYLNKSLNNNDLDKNIYLNYLRDILLYIHLTCKGKYWKFLMEKDNFDGDKGEYKKLSFGKVFFCRIHKNYKYAERKTFETHFKNVAKIIDYYKSEDYKSLSINMQKEEVDIVIHKIVKRIYNEHPKMFILTNHDAIYCTKEHIEYVMNVMLDEYFKKYNFTPTIKISPPLE